MIAGAAATERRPWRAVAVPTEHGGWGLTLEPVLLGLLVTFSWAGVGLGVAAVLAFLSRTPLKLALVDRRRRRTLERTRLAWRVAAVELAVVAVLAVAVVLTAGWRWLAPVALALPLVALELWFDVRSRSRRLLPELCGAAGIAAVAPAIVLAGQGDTGLAGGIWLVLAGRAVASIPFVRVQIARLHRQAVSPATSDASQLTGAAVAALAVTLDGRLVAGAIAVALLAGAQTAWVRRPVPPAKVLGLRQMALGFAVVAITAAGVLLG